MTISEIPSLKLNGEDRNPVEFSRERFPVKRLHRDDPLSCVIFPAFVDRAIRFISLFGADTDPTWLTQYLYSMFQTGSDESLLLVAVDGKGEIVAHSIVCPVTVQGQVWGFVMQLQKDVSDMAITETGDRMMVEWVRRKKFAGLMNMALNEKNMRVFRRRGYRIHRYLMVRPIGSEDKLNG